MDEAKINTYNSWCKWHPLKVVMLGRSYYPEYYRDIDNPKIRDCLVRIAEETEEDFLYYKKVLEDFGCHVIRPELDKNANIVEDSINLIGIRKQLPCPPAEPRDYQLVIGNELVYTANSYKSERIALENYNSSDVFDLTTDKRTHKKFDAPCITCVGKRIYIDEKEVDKYAWNILEDRYPERDFIHVEIGGHSDGCFHTLKEGVILSLCRYEDYVNTFPNWDVCYLPNQSWDLVKPFLDLKNKNHGKWWLPGEEKNDDFTEYVETWLQDWVGYVEETVFDVNVLMLDDKHVCVSSYNKTVFDYLKKHKIEPIIVPFRHRYFWDGGLHCITLDLYREGEMEDYFPKT